VLLDLTTRPIKAIPHECSSMFIVRTLGDGTVDAILRRVPDKKWEPESHEYLSPVETLKREQYTCHETKLRFRHADQHKGMAPNPYLVSTCYRDAITMQPGRWRLKLLVQALKERGMYLVTVFLDGEKQEVPLVSLQHRVGIEIFSELTPLQRFKRKGPAELDLRPSVWDRLADMGDYDDDDG
jgi:hypothetical protein